MLLSERVKLYLSLASGIETRFGYTVRFVLNVSAITTSSPSISE